MANPSSVTYSSSEMPPELLPGDSYISQAEAQITVNLDPHPSQNPLLSELPNRTAIPAILKPQQSKTYISY